LKMQLPSNRQEQIKLLIVVILATALVVLGAIQGVINPLRRSKESKLERLRQCEDGLASVRRILKFAPRDRTEGAAALAIMNDISKEHLLHPVLGNYALPASRLIELQLQCLGLQMDSINEIGITEVLHPKKNSGKAAIKCYTSRVSITCCFDDLISLLRGLETSNPYLCVVGMQISGRPDRDPENHSVLFDVQWPIWADDGMQQLIERELRDGGGQNP